MAYFFSPVGNSQQFDASGNPLSGGKIFTYLAGSTTPVASYTSVTGATPQANPIILNTLGLPANPIWLNGGVAVKFVITDAAGAVLQTVDNINGTNDTTGTQTEWVTSGLVPTFISATSFSVPGDQTGVLTIQRRLRTSNTAGTIYSTITASSFAASTTTVTVSNDTGALDSGISVVAYGLLAPVNPSVPSNYLVTLRSYLAGLTLSTAGASASFSIAAGAAADSANAVLMSLASAISKTTAAWSVGTAQGGLDAGVIANNTWYHVYLIRRPDTGVADVVFSTSAAAPTLPANYTQYRRIGALLTNGVAQWTLFSQVGDEFLLAAPTTLTASNPGTAAVSWTLGVPTGLQVDAIVGGYFNWATTGGASHRLYSFEEADAATSTSNATHFTVATSSTAASIGRVRIRTNTSAQIRTRSNGSGASDEVRINTLGWVDTRGRLS